MLWAGAETGGLGLGLLHPVEGIASGAMLMGAGGLMMYGGGKMIIDGWREPNPCP